MNTKLYVGNLPLDVTEDDLANDAILSTVQSMRSP